MNNKVEDLFSELLELSPDLREQHLATVNGSELEKAAAVRLLTAFESKSSLLNDDLLTDLANLDPDFFISQSDGDIGFEAGDRIGSYVIKKICGEGGMSIVYLAIQSEPIRRQVALKLIRPSVLSPKNVLRFFREQQALALVSHPNIATLYEVGTTDSGQPFAAMEYVDGAPITDFCRRHRVSTAFKIELFIKACGGLSQAHQRGIVHRDIKPDNMLVALRAKVALPKLIDFGIAKFMRTDMEGDKTVTRAGQVLGSPRYMSPEQIEGRQIDPRSDVYSAGLVLFELLSLSPYRKGDTAEMMMTNARTDVELLSDRIRSQRGTVEGEISRDEFKSLLKTVNRDLNWILAKALAREPDDRYPTIDAFLNDLKASYLGQPVSVATPGWLQRSIRSLNANRNAIGISACVALMLVCGLFFVNWRQSVKELSQVKIDSGQKISEVERKSVEQLSDAKRASAEKLLEVQRQQEKKLERIKHENQLNEQRNAASNELIIRLFASGQHQLTPEHIDLSSIQMYEDQFIQIRSKGGPANHQEKTVYGILAVFYAMSGNFDDADQLMEQVTDVERRNELQKVRERICENYAANAKVKLAQLASDDHSLERASQQLVLGRCYIVLDMLEESERLISEAIEIFDENQDANCEALIARNTLAKVYELAGRSGPRLELLSRTFQSFKDDDRLLATKRGHSAFAKTTRMLAASEIEEVKGDPNE